MLVTHDPMRPSRKSARRLIADATAALDSPCRPQTITCQDAVHLLGGGLPGSWFPSAAAVRAGDDFKQVTVRIFEVDTASAVVVIDLT
jgi:hypothetical protein